MSGARTLLVIPTYNEAGNIERLLREIQAQGLGLDLLVIDDRSPDGTGQLVDRLAAGLPLTVIHREGKLGIGSAHKRGFAYAQEHGYTQVLTMDADFAHDPSYLRRVLAHAGSAEVVVGSRYMPGGGLRGWSAIRLIITHTAHWCTTHLLGLPFDCTGGFRLYRVSVFERFDYQGIQSDGYAFLIEMLYHLARVGCSIREVPITITSRHRGVSKISRVEILNAVKTLARLRWQRQGPQRLLAADPVPGMDWDRYWAAAQHARPGLYARIAEFYRRQIISRAAAIAVAPHLPDGPGRHYLHAGCGSGGSDQRLRLRRAQVHALDLSPVALQLNRARPMPFPSWHVCGDLFRLPYLSGTMDGLFNFGVMEHFEPREIDAMLAEFRRVLKPGGRLILFWPPEFGLSVLFLKAVVGAARLFGKTLTLHPNELSRIPSFAWIRALMARSRFRMVEARFSWRDLFTYMVVVGEPLSLDEAPGARELAAPEEVAA